jgi:hypothetical protein
VLEVGACDEAELEVALQVIYGVAVQCQLLQLRRVLQTADVVEFLDSVVGQEDALEAGTVLEPVDRLDQVATQVELSKRDKAVQVLYSGDEVVREV